MKQITKKQKFLKSDHYLLVLLNIVCVSMFEVGSGPSVASAAGWL